MSEFSNIKLPGSLDSLVKFALDFDHLKRNIEFIVSWMNTTQNVLNGLQSKSDGEKERVDLEENLIPNLKAHLKMCLDEIQSMQRMKVKYR